MSEKYNVTRFRTLFEPLMGTSKNGFANFFLDFAKIFMKKHETALHSRQGFKSKKKTPVF